MQVEESDAVVALDHLPAGHAVLTPFAQKYPAPLAHDVGTFKKASTPYN